MIFVDSYFQLRAQLSQTPHCPPTARAISHSGNTEFATQNGPDLAAVVSAACLLAP